MYHVLYSIACYNPATGCYMIINNFCLSCFDALQNVMLDHATGKVHNIRGHFPCTNTKNAQLKQHQSSRI